MHILQIIINKKDPRLVHVIYDNETKKPVRLAIFEFDKHFKNATEIDYDSAPPQLISVTLAWIEVYLSTLK